MKIFKTMKDGGPESHVTGYFLVEIKSLFSVVLLHFANGTRESYHSHAFNALTWVLRGRFEEHHLDGRVLNFAPNLKPKYTSRRTFHKVVSLGNTYALSLRGPWIDKWREFKNGNFITLTHGRKVVG